jgi:hypothetical protein
VHLLAYERRAAAVAATAAIGLQSTHAAAQKHALELLYMAGDRRRHARLDFVVTLEAPAGAKLFASVAPWVSTMT